MLTTISKHGFNRTFASAACAMFCSRTAYRKVVRKYARTEAEVAPLRESTLPFWAAMVTQQWPPYAELRSDLGDNYFGGNANFDIGDVGSHFWGGSDAHGDGDSFDGGGFDGDAGGGGDSY